jgi:hypothetical protein
MEVKMTTATLEVVQQLVDQLTPLEQARLLEYLTPRVVRTVVSRQAIQATNVAPLAEAWQTFLLIGDQVAATDHPEQPTLTQSVQLMRR